MQPRGVDEHLELAVARAPDRHVGAARQSQQPRSDAPAGEHAEGDRREAARRARAIPLNLMLIVIIQPTGTPSPPFVRDPTTPARCAATGATAAARRGELSRC